MSVTHAVSASGICDVDRTVDHRRQQPPPGLTGGALEAALGS